MSNLLILAGTDRKAAEIFQDFYRRITGQSLTIAGDREDDGVSDLIVIGSDGVNFKCHQLVMDGIFETLGLRSGSDDYRMLSVRENSRQILILAGARPRATCYAVYDYFERFGNCRYFWDGDRIPTAEKLPLDGIDVRKQFRFRYRGLRYFAHRSLHRFQAEHWNLEDWKTELDYLLKKRFNLFMLRLGQDDLFQRAFDQVPYPPEDDFAPEARPHSFNDRTSFWSLRRRGELQRQIFQYARQCDLIIPEDMGAMTHWYTPTPKAFLEQYQPAMMPQSDGASYRGDTLTVWDFSLDRELEYYWQLTEKHIEAYGGTPDMFHIIGLAERKYGSRRENFQMKLYTYRRFIERLRRKYPNAPLLIASWDFLSTWQPEEVRSFLQELDPANTIIFDYTTDCDFRLNNFLHWGLPHQFPWVFGIFQALEPSNDLTFDFSRTDRGLELIQDDRQCQGMVLWSENSHANPRLLEYLAKHSASETFSLNQFCRDRYAADAGPMEALWQMSEPFLAENAFTHDRDRPTRGLFKEHFQFFGMLQGHADDWPNEAVKLEARHKLNTLEIPVEFFPAAATLAASTKNEMVRRDLIDLTRTVFGGYIAREQARLLLAFWNWQEHPEETTQLRPERLVAALDLMAELLEQSPEFSMYESLVKLEATDPINPKSEDVLKGNGEIGYCRSYIYEFYRSFYRDEAIFWHNWLDNAIKTENRSTRLSSEEWQKARDTIRQKFYDTPLVQLAPDPAKRSAQVLASILRKISSWIIPKEE